MFTHDLSFWVQPERSPIYRPECELLMFLWLWCQYKRSKVYRNIKRKHGQQLVAYSMLVLSKKTELWFLPTKNLSNAKPKSCCYPGNFVFTERMTKWFIIDLYQPQVVGDSNDQASSSLHAMNKQMMETTWFVHIHSRGLFDYRGLSNKKCRGLQVGLGLLLLVKLLFCLCLF